MTVIRGNFALICNLLAFCRLREKIILLCLNLALKINANSHLSKKKKMIALSYDLALTGNTSIF